MKHGIAVLASLSALVAVGYFTASKWAIRHETLTFYDSARDNRMVAVAIAVRRDKEMQANADMITLPVAVLNHYVATPRNSPTTPSLAEFSSRAASVDSILHGSVDRCAHGDENRRDTSAVSRSICGECRGHKFPGCRGNAEDPAERGL